VSNPEDKKSSKPPGDVPSGYVSPKLRSKMNLDDDEPDEGSGSKAANVIALVMLVAIVVLGTIFWTSLQRSKAEAKVKATQAAKLAAETARTDSLAKAYQDSIFAARADSTAKAEAKKPKPKPGTTPTATANPGGQPTAPAAPPPPPTKFGIDVGSFLSQDRANAEQGKLQTSTSLPARVVPTSEDGGTSYHVVIGEFTNRKDAEKKANDLIVAQTIREAKVTKLKP